jgi:hypothetical protein
VNSAQKVQLSGGPDKTATWIWLEPTGGRLKVEYYDFSEAAQRLFGNDIAYTITVDEMDKLFNTIHRDEATLVHEIARRFKSYFDIKQWLEESKIGFHVDIESWA